MTMTNTAKRDERIMGWMERESGGLGWHRAADPAEDLSLTRQAVQASLGRLMRSGKVERCPEAATLWRPNRG